MKKFSKITNQKVGDEPVIKNNVTEEDAFKIKVIGLMEQLLSIRTYGPIDRYLRQGSIVISGKELFLEALLDLMGDKSLKDQVKLLESLKSNMNDWESIDKKIDDVNVRIDESINRSKMLNHRQKLVNLYKLYKDDPDLFIKQVEDSASKIKNGTTAFWRGTTAEQMSAEGRFPRKMLKQASEIYLFRAKQLGHNR